MLLLVEIGFGFGWLVCSGGSDCYWEMVVGLGCWYWLVFVGVGLVCCVIFLGCVGNC